MRPSAAKVPAGFRRCIIRAWNAVEKESQVLQVLIVDSPDEATATSKMLADESQVFSIWRAGSLLEALDVLARRGFDIIVSELNLPDSCGLDTFEALRLHTRGIPIVIMTVADNEQLALSAVERGAQDYLIKGKVTNSALTRVIRYVVARHKGSQRGAETKQDGARAVGVMGVKGGVGTTTVAAHLAAAFAARVGESAGEKVLLVDLEANASSSSVLFETKPQFTLADAAGNLHRLDRKYWSGIVAETKAGVDLLNPPGSRSYNEMPAPERVRHVVRFARNFYPLVVVDLGVPGTQALEVIQEIQDLVLVVTPNLMEMMEARRALQWLSQTGLAADHIHLIWNRVTRHHTGAIRAFEKTLGLTAARTIPDCAAEIESNYCDGRFLDSRLPVRKEAEGLAVQLLGRDAARESRSLLALLFHVGRGRDKAPTPPANADRGFTTSSTGGSHK